MKRREASEIWARMPKGDTEFARLISRLVTQQIRRENAAREAELDLAIHSTCAGEYDWVDAL